MGKVTGLPRGRPAGSKNKRTLAVKQAAAVARAHIEATVPDAFDGDAHALLMSIYKDPRHPIDLRLDAAGKAIRYEKPALATVDVTSEGTFNVRDVSDQPATADEWATQFVTEH